MVRSLVLSLIVFLAAALAPLERSQAQPGQPGAAAAARLDATAKGLREVQHAVTARASDSQLASLREQAMALEAQAASATEALAPALSNAQARVDQLGPPPKSGAEAPDIQRQRRQLQAELERLDGLTKRGKLMTLEAEQLADRIVDLRRSRFNAEVLERTESPLSPAFWREVFLNATGDTARVLRAAAEAAGGFERMEPQEWGALIGGLLWAVLVMFPLRLGLERLAQQRMINRAPGNRLRRSGLAVLVVALGFLAPLAAGYGLVFALRWAGALTPTGVRVAEALLMAVGVGAYVAALGRGLLLPGRSSWRLLPISEASVRAVSGYPAIIGAVIGAGVVLEQVNRIVGASLSANIVTNGVIAMLDSGVTAAFLLSLGRVRRRALEAAADGDAPAKASAWGALTVCVWAAVIAVMVALAFGYVALAVAIARQAVWIGMVGGTAYLLLKFTDDAFTSLLNGKSGFGRYAALSLGVKPAAADQLGVLLSGVLRILLLLLAAAAVAAPFGADLSGLFGQVTRIAGGFKIGEVTISPGAVATALLSFAVGVALVRTVRRWLDDKYLPTTELEAGVRTSLSTVAGYVGMVLVGCWALAILGIGLQRIALVASALSVGIGFGLQAIVQNFISGLILLAERPVKVGDLVVVAGQEGDIRRINVRATEIQMADRSTLLVPNSELITKTVVNKTLASPLGRIQIELDVDPAADPDAVREIMLAVFEAEPAVQAEPPPAVFLDSIRASGFHFNAFAHVASPRDAYPVRSRMLFEMIRRFREAGIEMGRPPAAAPLPEPPAPVPPLGEPEA